MTWAAVVRSPRLLVLVTPGALVGPGEIRYITVMSEAAEASSAAGDMTRVRRRRRTRRKRSGRKLRSASMLLLVVGCLGLLLGSVMILYGWLHDGHGKVVRIGLVEVCLSLALLGARKAVNVVEALGARERHDGDRVGSDG